MTLTNPHVMAVQSTETGTGVSVIDVVPPAPLPGPRGPAHETADTSTATMAIRGPRDPAADRDLIKLTLVGFMTPAASLGDRATAMRSSRPRRPGSNPPRAGWQINVGCGNAGSTSFDTFLIEHEEYP